MLLSILLFQTGGMFIIFKIQQCFVQYEMTLTIKNNSSSFEKLVLTPGEYKKSRINSGEISFNGNMYDVKSVTLSAGKVELLVINDKNETSILEAIKAFVHKTGQHNRECPNQLQQLFALHYLSPDTGYNLIMPAFFVHVFSGSKLNIISNDLDISTPPPELV